MKNKLLIFCFTLLNLTCLYAQSYNYGDLSDFDQTNNIRCYLNNKASQITNNSLNDIKSLDDWESIRNQRRDELIEMMGLQGMPFNGKRSPLNVTKTGVIQKDGYRIEKLYYESLPGLYVPANLYIPDGIKKPVPAILYVCGHSHTQKHHYQAHAKNFAQNGFVCLIIETIQRGEVKGEHLGQESLGWFNWYSRGYNPGGVEVWNGIRGLDLLSQLPEVDKENLGVTGISGGGSQSWYLPAIDSRVKAAAAVAGAGSLKGQIIQKTIDDHCDCMMPVNTYGIDFSDIGALIAPRSFMIAQPDRDLYYSIEAVHEIYDKIKPIYSFYNKLDKLVMQDAIGPHSYGSKEELRPIILSFFMKELMGKDIDQKAYNEIDIANELSNEELLVYTDGVPDNDRTKYIQNSFVELATPPDIKNVQQLDAYRNLVVDFLKEKTFRAFPKKPSPLDIRMEFKSISKSGNKRTDYSFVPEDGWRLRVSLRKNVLSKKGEPLLLVLKNPEEGRWESGSLVSDVRSKATIAYFEARGIGETGWSPSLQWHIRRSAAWTGRTVASMRVYDVLRCLEALRKIPGINSENIYVVAQGEMAAIASYAALLDGNIHSLILKNPPASQDVVSKPNGSGMSIEMLNCLRITDLPQVTGLMFPKPVISIGKLPDSYQWVETLYKNLQQVENFKNVEKISEWIKK